VIRAKVNCAETEIRDDTGAEQVSTGSTRVASRSVRSECKIINEWCYSRSSRSAG